MNRWQQKFDEHPIHETLRLLNEYISTLFEDINEDETQERRRFLKIISTYQELLSELDAELVPLNQLDSLNNGLKAQHIWNQITSYASNQNVSHLITANDHLTNQLTQLSLLLAIAKKTKFIKPFKKVEDIVDDFSRTITSQKSKLQEELKELSTSLNQRQQELQKLEELMESRKNESDSQMSKWQEQFSQAQDRRQTEYATWSKKFEEQSQKDLKELIEQTTSELNNQKETFESNLKTILDDGNLKHKAILELYELTAGDSVGAGYIKNANDEMKQANNWRIISIGFIITTIIWLICVYFSSESTISLPKIITAFSLTGVMLYGAAYSSQQSTKHRNNEKKARWFALEIKAFDPFISSLKEDQQHKLKEELSKRIFGQNEHSALKDGSVIDEHAYKTIVDSIGSLLTKIPRG